MVQDVAENLSIFLALLVVPLLLLKMARQARGNGAGRPRLPPGPWRLPVIGSLHHLMGKPHVHRAMADLARRHGAPLMYLKLGEVPFVVASSPDAAREILKAQDANFASRPWSPTLRVMMADGEGLAFARYGAHWRRLRKICVVELLGPRRVQSFRRIREEEVAALLDRVRRHRGSGGGAVNLSNMLMSYANGVISRAAFGDGSYGFGGDEGGEKLRKLFADFEGLLGTATVGEFVPWLAWVDKLMGLDAKAARTSAAMDGLLERVIADHRERRRRRGQSVGDGDVDVDHRDFVDVLLDVSEAEEDAGAGVQFDTVAIKAIILDMIAAATDTTFTTLEWAMAELINHPPVMRKLQDEIRAAVGGVSGDDEGGRCHAGGGVTEDHLGELRFLKAVIKETLRMHAPVPLLVPRETVEDTELLGYRVPARTRVVINAWAIGRDPSAWGEHAEEFMPERWFDGGGGGKEEVEYALQLGQDFRFVPFGAGRRGCPGAGFAAPSLELALANLLYHFDWELPAQAGRAAAARLDMAELYGLSMRLKAALNLVAKPWSSDV